MPCACCYASLSHGTVGWSAVCDCGISAHTHLLFWPEIYISALVASAAVRSMAVILVLFIHYCCCIHYICGLSIWALFCGKVRSVPSNLVIVSLKNKSWLLYCILCILPVVWVSVYVMYVFLSVL